MPIWREWKQKPPQGTPVNRQHRLAQSLLGFYPLQPGNSADALGTYDLTPSATAIPVNGAMNGLRFTANTSNLESPTFLPARLLVQPPVTLAIGLRLVGAASNTVPLFTVNQNHVITSTNLGMLWTAASQLLIQWNLSTGSFTPAATVPFGDHVISVTFLPTGVTVYVDGKAFDASVTPITAGAYPANTYISIGGASANPSRLCNVFVYWAGWWNRGLSATEHSQIGSSLNSIWQIMQPAHADWLYGDTPFRPSVARQNQPVIGSGVL